MPGKGGGVTAAPSPKNRTGQFPGIRLKPPQRPVRDAVQTDCGLTVEPLDRLSGLLRSLCAYRTKRLLPMSSGEVFRPAGRVRVHVGADLDMPAYWHARGLDKHDRARLPV